MKVRTKIKSGWCDHACKKECKEAYKRCGTKPNCYPKYERCINRCGCH